MGKPQHQSATEPDDGEIDFLSDWEDEPSIQPATRIETKPTSGSTQQAEGIGRYDVDGTILQRIVWHPDATHREKILLLKLYDIYGEDDFEIERGVLAAELDMSVQQITKLLARMKRIGLIDWKRTYSEHGLKRIRHVIGCIYRITA